MCVPASLICACTCVSMCSKCWLMYLWLCQPFGIGGTGVTLPQSTAQTSHITAQWGHCATNTFQHRALGLLQAGGSHLCVWESGCVEVCVCVAAGEGDLEEICSMKGMCSPDACPYTLSETPPRLRHTHSERKTQMGQVTILQSCKISVLCVWEWASG